MRVFAGIDPGPSWKTALGDYLYGSGCRLYHKGLLCVDARTGKSRYRAEVLGKVSPTFADGMFLVRNLTHMAAVRIDRSLAPQVAQVDDSDRLRGEFGQWIASVEALSASERRPGSDLVR